MMITLGATAVASAEDEPPVRPNVVLVLLDDASENLYPYLSEVSLLREQGVTFANYFNATPWCCPSRASVQAGKYPHNTQVRSNGYPAGGFEQFLVNDMDSSVGVQMQAAGYRTGFMGKYLNGYRLRGVDRPDRPNYRRNFVPPGWDSWFSGSAYQHFNYQMLVDESDDRRRPSRLTTSGDDAANYFTDVLSARAQEFLRHDSADPFFLMLTPFAPHGGLGGDLEGRAARFPAAPRDRADSAARPAHWGEPEFIAGDCGPVRCQDVPWPDTTSPGNFNQAQENPLEWMATAPLPREKVEKGRGLHIQRIQMVQSVNDMLRDLRLTLEETGQADATYVMFTSDNGYHLGEHALFGGKTTAYDHDIRTPLVVRPPGGLATGVSSTALVQNIDILPTLVSVAGAAVPADVDGISLLPLMERPDLPWRDTALLELTNDKGDPDARYFNPDLRGFEGDHVAPTYNALRSHTYLYVDFSAMDQQPPGDHQAEYYDLASDPDQMINRYPELSPEQRLALNAELAAQTTCTGASCALLQGWVPPNPEPTETPTETVTPTEEPTPTETPTETAPQTGP